MWEGWIVEFSQDRVEWHGNAIYVLRTPYNQSLKMKRSRH